ncbi:hypothetical protein AMTR_s00037p00182150 [Amborella trichopoda]|uniref:Uncharacterized protein n=1 Tax=Amborella trichopoda TaxID=13333 RepID=U5CVM2_AMBTC|nr:hypothetical protein AMTR_s00037p00182150 [Amborella trichopoda]
MKWSNRGVDAGSRTATSGNVSSTCTTHRKTIRRLRIRVLCILMNEIILMIHILLHNQLLILMIINHHDCEGFNTQKGQNQGGERLWVYLQQSDGSMDTYLQERRGAL